MEVYQPIDAPRLSPALTRDERLHLDLYGFVLLETVLDSAQVEDLRNAVYGLEDQVRAGEALAAPAYLHSGSSLWFRIDNLPHLEPLFLAYLTHPKIWGAAEEAIGGDARLEQSDVSIHRPGPDGQQEGFGLHRGPQTGGEWVQGGLYHFPFVKALTLLTDVGPDDGGTVVVPGSHKLAPEAVKPAMAAAESNPALRHAISAPAGSTLLFFESTIHGSGTIRSDKDRMYIVGGYTPTMYQPWHEYDIDPAWAAQQSPAHEAFLTGSNRWLWKPRIRDLAVEAPETLEAARQRVRKEADAGKARAEKARAAQKALQTRR